MTDITELRKSVDSLNASTNAASKKQSYTLVQRNIESLAAEYESVQKQLAIKENSLAELKKENLSLKQDYSLLNNRLQEILKEKSETEKKLEQLSRTRPELSSSNLVKAFRDSLDEMDTAMKSGSSRVSYNVSSMNIKLRTNIAVQNNELRFQLPKPDDVIPAGNLSEVEFTISSTANEPMFSEYIDVPDVVGLDMDSAVSAIMNAGFTKGKIIEKESDLVQGTVLSQIPSGNAVAKSGDAVDIVISKITSVSVPDLTGITLAAAKKKIADGNLTLGIVTEKENALKAGTIIDQSVAAGEYADIGTAIDLTLAGRKKEEIAAPAKEKAISDSPKTSSLKTASVLTKQAISRVSAGKSTGK